MEAKPTEKALRTESEVTRDYNIMMASVGDSVRQCIETVMKGIGVSKALADEMNAIHADNEPKDGSNAEAPPVL